LAIEPHAATQAIPVLSFGGKGVVMRKEGLREATRKRAEASAPQVPRGFARQDKSNRKRMATVAAIYHIDREFARDMGDPLRTVVEAPTKIAAEEAASRLGFGEPWAHPVRPSEVGQAEWLPKRRPGHRQELARAALPGIRNLLCKHPPPPKSAPPSKSSPNSVNGSIPTPNIP